MVTPDEEAEETERDRAHRNEHVAVDVAAAERCDELVHNRHTREDHDVDRRMRVEPEEVLEEDGIATERRVEDTDLKDLLDEEKEHGDGEDRRREDLNDRGGVKPPNEEREAIPAEPRRPHLMRGGDEVQTREDRAEPQDKHAHRHPEHAVVAAR